MPTGHSFRAFDVDPKSGDLAVISAGGTKDRHGTWLFLCRAADLEGDTIHPTALLFEGNVPVSLRYKRFADRTLLFVVREDALWVLDPQTLRCVQADDKFRTRIDLEAEQYDTWLRPKPDPKVSRTWEPDGSYVLYSSAKEDDPTVVLGLGWIKGQRGIQGGRRLNLVTGEITESVTVPTRDLTCAAAVGHNPAIQDPHGELSAPREHFSQAGDAEKKLVETVSYQPLGVLAKRPWIVGRDATRAQFYDRHDPSKKIELLLPTLLQVRQASWRGPPTAFGDDAIRDRLILAGNPDPATHEKAWWGVLWVLPINAAALPDRPLPVAQLDMPDTIEPGKPVSIPLSLPDGRTRVSLLIGPQGAKIAGGKLQWTPKVADLGSHEFVFRVSAGSESVERKSSVRVEYGAAPLGFDALAVHISGDGTRALAWNAQRMGLVDVRTRQVLSERNLQHPISKAVLSDRQAFVLFADGNTVEQCSLDDLKPIETLCLTEAIQDVEVLENRFLFLFPRANSSYEGAGRKFHAFELPAVNETQLTQILSGGPRARKIGPTPSGWLIGPAILDERLQTIASLLTLDWANVFYLANPLDAPGTSVIEDGSTRRATVLGGGGSKSVATATLAGGALTASVQMVDVGDRSQPSLRRITLSFSGPSKDSKVVQFPIAEFKVSLIAHVIAASGRGVAIAAGGKLFTLFPEELGVEVPPAPSREGLVLRAKVPLSELTERERTTLQFVADGGKPPYEFSCRMTPGVLEQAARDPAFQDKLIGVDAKSGSVTIDGPLFLRTLLAEDSYRLSQVVYDFARRRWPGSNAAGVVERYTRETSDTLQPLVRRPLRGFPAVVPIVVSVKDAASHEVRLSHELLVELPPAKIIELLEGQLSRHRGSTPAEPLARLGIPDPVHPNAQIVPRPDLPLIWNDGTQVDISSEIRRLWPPVAIDDPQWSVERLAACSVIMGSAPEISETRDPRLGGDLPVKTWRTTTGKEVTGRLVGASDRDIMVRAEGGYFGESLGVNVLDEESLDNAWVGLQRLRRGTNPSCARLIRDAR